MTLKEHFAKGKFPALYARKDKFPGGESFDDVRARAKRVWEEQLERYTRGQMGKNNTEDLKSDERDIHVAIISHGVFLTELVSVILAKGALEGLVPIKEFRGMRNTGWTRFSVAAKVSSSLSVYEEYELKICRTIRKWVRKHYQ